MWLIFERTDCRENDRDHEHVPVVNRRDAKVSAEDGTTTLSL